MLEHYINDIKKYPPLPREEEVRLMALAQTGDTVARDRVIHSNLRFVFQIAKVYQGRGLDFDDLLAEGNLGLIKAFDRFDTSRGVKFISYAVWWIRQSILNALYKNVTMVKIPISRVVTATKTYEIKAQLEHELQREPTLTELREFITDPEALQDMENIYAMVRIDLPRSESGDLDLHEVLYEEEALEPDQISDEFIIDFKSTVRDLTEREKEILQLYFGIGHVRPHTLREIGAILGLTRERVRQIKQHVIQKLQKKKTTQKLKEYM